MEGPQTVSAPVRDLELEMAFIQVVLLESVLTTPRRLYRLAHWRSAEPPVGRTPRMLSLVDAGRVMPPVWNFPRLCPLHLFLGWFSFVHFQWILWVFLANDWTWGWFGEAPELAFVWGLGQTWLKAGYALILQFGWLQYPKKQLCLAIRSYRNTFSPCFISLSPCNLFYFSYFSVLLFYQSFACPISNTQEP